MTNVYLDASALLPLLVADAFSNASESAIARAGAVTVSDWTTTECVSAIGRAVRMGLMPAADGQALCAAMDAWVSENAERVGVEGADIQAADALIRQAEFKLRAPDALHVVVAKRLQLPLLTFDKSMVAGAGRIGVELYPA